MNQTSLIYPEAPKHVNEKIIKPSKEFRREVLKAVSAIVFFILVYLLLIIAAIGLAVLCGIGGISLISAYPKFITLIIGLGIVVMGIMVIYFLLKFIFKTSRIDRSHLIEISIEQQPELFSFIKKITAETRTPFPKKIYLSCEVNAAVFYDSSFWSMFVPVKKNLQIGLGLVNSLNISEFKAVLAHEFGHFSQRSMKLGSYCYNVNKIIFDMLFDNVNYGKTLQAWGSVSGYFTFFAGLTVKIIQGIQWILQQVYSIVNKSYMSLSRQMEFHADAVAASVSGSMPLITSLQRFELTDTCYETILAKYNSWITDNLKPDNMYAHQMEVMKYFAEYYRIPFEHGVLKVSDGTQSIQNKSRLTIKDQWASHPSNKERINRLLALNVYAEMIYESAWSVFRDSEQIQKQMTEKVFENVKYETAPQTLDITKFIKKYKEESEKNNYARAYKGFYDGRNPAIFNIKETASEASTNSALTLDTLLNDANCNLPSFVRGLEFDIQDLIHISNNRKGSRSFDFDGEKYHVSDALIVKSKLEEELKMKKQQLVELDRDVFRFFYKKAVEKNEGIKFLDEYEKVFSILDEADKNIKMYNEYLQIMQPIYSVMKHEDRVRTIGRMKEKEAGIKQAMAKILADDKMSNQIEIPDREKLEKYISEDLEYYYSTEYHQTNLEKLSEALSIFGKIIFENNFQEKKKLRDKQLELLN